MAVDERMVNAVERRVRSWRVPPLVADALLTLIVLAPSLGSVLAGPDRITGPLLWLAVALTLLQTLPLVARSRWPLGVLAVTATAEALSLVFLPLNGGPGRPRPRCCALHGSEPHRTTHLIAPCHPDRECKRADPAHQRAAGASK